MGQRRHGPWAPWARGAHARCAAPPRRGGHFTPAKAPQHQRDAATFTVADTLCRKWGGVTADDVVAAGAENTRTALSFGIFRFAKRLPTLHEIYRVNHM